MVAVAERIGAVELVPGRGDEARGTLRLRAVGRRRASEVERASRHRARQRWDALAAITAYATGPLPARCPAAALPRPPRAGADRPLLRRPRAARRSRGGGTTARARTAVSARPRPRARRSAARASTRSCAGSTHPRPLRRAAPLRQRRGPRPADVLAAIDAAIAEGELASSGGARPVLRPPGRRRAAGAAAPVDADLAARLRDWRLERSRSDGVPAYVVLDERCLDEVCRRLPGDEDELLEVPGVGPARIERYGQDVLELVRTAPGAGASRPPLPV